MERQQEKRRLQKHLNPSLALSLNRYNQIKKIEGKCLSSIFLVNIGRFNIGNQVKL